MSYYVSDGLEVALLQTKPEPHPTKGSFLKTQNLTLEFKGSNEHIYAILTALGETAPATV